MTPARFAGQTIIVTGAGRGLGEAIARRFAAGITGANLVVDGGLTANWFILETLPAP